MKKSFENALNKARTTEIWVEYTSPTLATNPYSGATVTLNALEASIYFWCKKWESKYNWGKMLTPISTFDNMRYLFLELNPSAYMELLD